MHLLATLESWAHSSSSTALARRVLRHLTAAWLRHRTSGGAIEHRGTRPYRPQTNGKVERFHRTLADEWAYARLYTSDAERCTDGYTPTITTAATQHSTVNHPPAAYLTSQIRTARRAPPRRTFRLMNKNVKNQTAARPDLKTVFPEVDRAARPLMYWLASALVSDFDEASRLGLTDLLLMTTNVVSHRARD